MIILAAEPSPFEYHNEPSSTSTDSPSPDPSVKLVEIQYTDEQLNQISELAKSADLVEVYLPAIAVEDCPLTHVEVHENKLILQYKYMMLELSKKAWDEMNDVQMKQVTLANGATGEWISGKDDQQEAISANLNILKFSYARILNLDFPGIPSSYRSRKPGRMYASAA